MFVFFKRLFTVSGVFSLIWSLGLTWISNISFLRPLKETKGGVDLDGKVK